MSIRHAAVVAAASIEKMLEATASTSEMVRLQRQLVEFEMCSQAAQLAFLDVMVRMSDDLKLATLFELFDDDSSGDVSANELGLCLQKLDKSKSFRESLDAAIISLCSFDANEDGMMDVHEFGLFLTDLVGSLQCPFSDLAQLMAMRVAFEDHGASVLDAGIAALLQDCSEALVSPQAYNAAVTEVRMLLLFQVLDYDQNQAVRFEDFVKSLVNVARDMDEIPRQALLMCDSRAADRMLDYDHFSELLLNVVAAGNFVFHEVANSMTLAICKSTATKNDLAALFLGEDIINLSLDDNKVANMERLREKLRMPLEYGRMSRLFDLWDLDHSGTLEYSEFALGMRKFQEAKDIDTTVEETMAAMVAYDSNNDQKLDRKEFAEFLIHFAEASDVSLNELIDFMVVMSSLRDNSEAEAKYITSIKG